VVELELKGSAAFDELLRQPGLGGRLAVDYDPLWALEFLGERVRLVEVLGAVAKGIEH
jgi:hypothetical protein